MRLFFTTFVAMKRLQTVIMSLLVVVCATAQTKRNTLYEAYIERYKSLAIEQMNRYGIPASITLAQGLLESGAGQSSLARQSNNHFGIKCHGWTGRTTYHDDDAPDECFRAYKDVRDSYEDHSVFLSTQQRYARLFRLQKNDYKGWARGLKSCGYATNPRYAESLISIIETYGLYEYDSRSSRRHRRKGASSAQQGQSHQIYAYNDNLFIRVRRGDTFGALADELGISARKLAKYNERDRRDVLNDGERIYLKKKRSKADRRYKGIPHTVKAGESMYSIAQLYGIRLSSLYKKNHLSPDYTIAVGDKLRVY